MKKCPPGVICTDKSTVWLAVVVAVFVGAAAFYFAPRSQPVKQQEQKSIYIMTQPIQQQIQPPVQRIQDPPPLLHERLKGRGRNAAQSRLDSGEPG
jgi:hypothetical protein